VGFRDLLKNNLIVFLAENKMRSYKDFIGNMFYVLAGKIVTVL
jgi:hypothetical protein